MATQIPDTFDRAFIDNAQAWPGTLATMPKGKTPLAFIKAVTWNESRFNVAARPVDKTGKLLSSALGLFQIIKPTLAHYNATHTAKVSYEELVVPARASVVGGWLIRRIVQEYAEVGSVLSENWQDADYAGLVALGYVVGWSRKAGVAHIVERLLRSGFRGTLNPTTVIAYASKWYPNVHIYDTGGGYMSDPALATHIIKIQKDYVALLGKQVTPPKQMPRDPPMVSTPRPPPQHQPDRRPVTDQKQAGVGLGGILLAGAAVGGAAYLIRRKMKRETTAIPNGALARARGK